MFAKPVMGPVTSPYGPRPPLPFHNGVDFGWLYRDPERSRRVVAPTDGVVSVGRNSLIGNFVSLAVTPNDVLRLCHLASVAVKSGQNVKRGQLVGIMGDTGSQASGVHLHVDYYRNGVRVDPAPHFTLPFPGVKPASLTTTLIESEEDDMALRFGTDETGKKVYLLGGPAGPQHVKSPTHLTLLQRYVRANPELGDSKFTDAEYAIIRSYFTPGIPDGQVTQTALQAALRPLLEGLPEATAKATRAAIIK